MAFVNKIKKQVDLPVWEWMRFAPYTTADSYSLTTANTLRDRYMYYMVTGTFSRYDTITDSWEQLQSAPLTVGTASDTVYNTWDGHYGRVISSGDGNNTLEIAGLTGNALKGYKIRIISGTGAGQEKTITNVSEPIVKDFGIVTSGGNTVITDTTTGIGIKNWRVNQWRDYQVRVTYGTGVSEVRPILYNTISSIYIYDTGYAAITPWWGAAFQVSAATNASQYQIESNIITVDGNWDVPPDNTSNFKIISGGVWCISSYSSAPYYTWQYYDVVGDFWYYKGSQTGLINAALSTDVALERFTEAGGAILSGSATSGTARSLTDTNLNLTPNKYANYEIYITSGSGTGERITITGNNSNTFYFTSSLRIAPNTGSTYEIYRDTDKILMLGHLGSAMFQYSKKSEMWSTNRQLEAGSARQMSATIPNSDLEGFGLTSISRTTGAIKTLDSSPSVAGSGYLINQLLTISTGGANAIARITGINSTGGVTSVVLEAQGSGYVTGIKATTVSPSGGTGCTVNISATCEIAYATTTLFHNFKLGDTVTVAGAVQTDYNGNKVILGLPAANVFTYEVLNSPITATFTAHTSTMLVDTTKNWTINEHVGKIIQMVNANGSYQTTATARRIVSNTANSISWTLAATVPVNGYKYIIEDSKPFGADMSTETRLGGGNKGYATSGTTSSLTDTTKSWRTNVHSYSSGGGGRKIRIVSGTGVGNEIQITSNTANTLSYATQTFTPDTSTQYIIMDSFGVATGGTTTTLVDATQNWATNIWIGKRVRFLTGTSQGNEYTITSNTVNTLTFSAGTAPDVSTQYAILELSPRGAGLGLECIHGCSDSTIKNKYLYSFRGATTLELNRYSIPDEQWELVSYYPQSIAVTMPAGSMYVYDSQDRLYFTNGTTGRIYYYDLAKNTVVPSGLIPYNMSTARVGNRMEIIETDDGLRYLYLMRHSGTEFWRTLLFW